MGGGLQRSPSISAASDWPHWWTQHYQLTQHPASHELTGRILSNLPESDLDSEKEVVAKGGPPQGLTYQFSLNHNVVGQE